MTKPLARVDIVEIEDTLAAQALRGALEYWGVQVTTHWVGMAQDIVRLLGGEEKLSEIVVLMCHGNDKGLVLPALHPSIERKQPYHGALTPQDLEEFLKLPGLIVLNTGCSLGTETFARSFLAAGCKAYIGATGDPEGSSALFHSMHLFYELICRHTPLRKAHALARSHDQETGCFHLREQDATRKTACTR
jgi:hypothetical protein